MSVRTDGESRFFVSFFRKKKIEGAFTFDSFLKRPLLVSLQWLQNRKVYKVTRFSYIHE